MAPVALTSVGVFGAGISARLLALKPISAVAHIPGEVSGPALAITVQFDNESTKPIDLINLAVAVTGPGARPENQIVMNGTVLLRGTLAAGTKARGVYVFTVPIVDRSRLSVAISYSARAPVAVFVGSAQ